MSTPIFATCHDERALLQILARAVRANVLVTWRQGIPRMAKCQDCKVFNELDQRHATNCWVGEAMKDPGVQRAVRNLLDGGS